MTTLRKLALRLAALALAAAAAAQSLAPQSAAPQSAAPQPTYGGLSLAQWLRPGTYADQREAPPELAAELTRERALAAFGVDGEPMAFLLRVLTDPVDGPALELVLATLPALADGPQFAAALQKRWRCNRGHAGVLATLLAVDPGSWAPLADEVRAELGAHLVANGPQAQLSHPLWRVVPVAAVAADTDWQELLGKVLDGVAALPAPRDLAAPFAYSPRLVAAIARTQNGALPNLAWLDVLQASAPELAAQLPQFEADLRISMAQHAEALVRWRQYPDYDPPSLDARFARLLGVAGPAALPLCEKLLVAEETRYSGLLALGQMARSELLARARLGRVLDALAAKYAGMPDAFQKQPPGVPASTLRFWWPMAHQELALPLLTAIRLAGEPMLADLLPQLRAANPATTKVLALDALRSLWAIPGSPFAMEGARAPFELTPLLPLLNDPDEAVREAVLPVAVGVAPYVPLTAGELAGLSTRLEAAKTLTPQLRIDTWRAWADHGAWLLRIATHCEAPVAESVRWIASTSPSAQPLAPPVDTAPFGAFAVPWYQRVRGCERLTPETFGEGIARGLEQMREHDPDLLVRAAAQRALARLSK